MTRMLLATLLAALPVAGGEQARPDFTGTWAMDTTRSVSPTYPEFGGPVMVVITQTESEITIETRQGGRAATVTYLPGHPGSTPAGAGDPRRGASSSRFYWDDTKLVTETVRLGSDAPEGTFRTKEVRSLNAGGTEMTVETTLVVEHGYDLKGTRNHETGTDIYKKSGS